MSTYVMSDIHGCYDKYEQMKEKIGFTQEDSLYIIGDVIDRGDKGISILLDIMKMKREGFDVHLLKGNHEYLAYATLFYLMPPLDLRKNLDDTALELVSMWMANGGKPTLEEYSLLSEQQQIDVLSFMRTLPLYKCITVGTRDFVLVHSGFSNFSPDKPLDEYSVEDLTEGRHSHEAMYFPDKTVIVGHTPTAFFGEEYVGKIVFSDNLINIDCGAAFDVGALGCLRLDDFAEFYV